MSTTTKLPTPSGSVGTWGAELNDFLTQSMVGTTTGDVTNGLLKADHAAITTGGKVGIGTSAPSAIFEVASQGVANTSTVLHGGTSLPGSGTALTGSYFNFSTNEDTYIRGGLATSNININDNSKGVVRIANGGGVTFIGSETLKLGSTDINLSVTGSNTESGSVKVQGLYPSFTFADGTSTSHVGTDNNGSLGIYTKSTNNKLNSSVEVPRILIALEGNVGINTTAPTSKLQVVGLPTFADDMAANTGGLTAGAFYKTSTGQLFVKL